MDEETNPWARIIYSRAFAAGDPALVQVRFQAGVLARYRERGLEVKRTNNVGGGRKAGGGRSRRAPPPPRGRGPPLLPTPPLLALCPLPLLFLAPMLNAPFEPDEGG